ncbi:MAG: MBL fold metallo-hydrolase [Rickettsiales bacterium]
MNKLLTTAIFLSLTFSNAAIADDHHKPTDVTIKPTKITENIYMLEGEGGNIGVLRGGEKTILIDSQFSNLSEKIQKAVSDISDKPIVFLLNTHHHFDHTGGNENFEKSGANIIAHKNVRTRLKNGSYIEAFDKKMEPATSEILPILTYDSGINLYEAGEEIELLHYPNAHTDGDTAIFFKTSNVIHTGDIYFNAMYPFIDESNGGSVDGYIKAMEAIIDRADENTKIIPGHGKLSDKSQMKKDLAMLKDMSDIIKEAVKNATDKGEILKNPIVQKHDATYGKGFLSTKKFIGIIYSIYKNSSK